MGSVNLDNTGSGNAITLSSDGTSLLLNGTAIGGGGGATDLNDLTPCVSNTTTDNYGIGRDVLGDITSGQENVAFGALAGQQITTGSANTFYGRNAGRFVTTGSGNVGIGQNAATGTNVNKQTGDYNVGIGYQAGDAVVSTDKNTAIGYNADNSGNPSGSTAIGSEAVAAGSQATALTDSYASGADSFAAAISSNSSSYGATGANSIAMGKNAKATAQEAVCISNTSTASGSNAAVLGGSSGTASGSGSVALGGSSNVADGVYSTAKGYYGNANGVRLKHATGVYPNQQGAYYVLGYTTSDATPIALNTSVWTPSSTNQIVLPNNSAYAFHGTIVARQQAADGTACAAWKVEGLIRREGSAGTTVLVNSATTVLDNTPNWGMALSADTTNGCLKIQATGAASTDIRWVATIHTSEVTYA